MFIYSLKSLSKMSIDIVGNFNTLAFNDSISSLVRLTKLVLYQTMKLETLVYLKL